MDLTRTETLVINMLRIEGVLALIEQELTDDSEWIMKLNPSRRTQLVDLLSKRASSSKMDPRRFSERFHLPKYKLAVRQFANELGRVYIARRMLQSLNSTVDLYSWYRPASQLQALIDARMKSLVLLRESDSDLLLSALVPDGLACRAGLWD